MVPETLYAATVTVGENSNEWYISLCQAGYCASAADEKGNELKANTNYGLWLNTT